MWSDWKEDIVRHDLQVLARHGLQILRVFPLWPDFQPITLLRAGAGTPKEVRFGEAPLPEDDAGFSGVNPIMMSRFRRFADLAETMNLKLIVGILTGWMSGRLFVPPALEGRNVLSDPFARLWQVRFVRFFVREMKDHPAILAWDLGNECNCMAPLSSPEEAWEWTSAITTTIRAEDPFRPVISGMHSLSPDPDAIWRIQDQAEWNDILTTHPYPYFTPYCDLDPIHTIRTILHSTAETRFYADIGGKPTFPEELGTLGPFLASDRIAADFARTCLFSLWAHGCHGLLWWCAFDQSHLEHAPYDWNACERELGLLTLEHAPKPVLIEFGNFRRWLEKLPIHQLPETLKDAVCILSHDQDQWGVAFATFILSKQAGFDLSFRFADQSLPSAPCYLLPCVRGQSVISRQRWLQLLNRVREGAILYVSYHDGLLSPFNEPFGVEIQTRSHRSQAVHFTSSAFGELTLDAPIRLELALQGAKALAVEPDGNPVFTLHPYGKGKIIFLSLPLEITLVKSPGVFYDPKAQPFWKIYQMIFEEMSGQKISRKSNPQVGTTEHPLDETTRLLILINYSPSFQNELITLPVGWKPDQSWRGEPPEQKANHEWVCSIPANDAIVFTVKRSIL
ncbi:endo-beta-mannanase [Anaerolinea thermolimosa]|uniref:glycoside hydrolase 5 family protein n=1 Tax=Anaerolinea thermolimosa TaxID=229919 RepID=UPI000783F817|nr:hypothetical protein [Anaerolinea thermolimosa]GAP06754.1 endo-beta-mannanase [Anaerolinea thermolimosa]